MKNGILLDTHTVIWYLVDPDKLSPAATAAIDSAFLT
jgi:PIN domain nuclease of toxin-antitoxin system